MKTILASTLLLGAVSLAGCNPDLGKEGGSSSPEIELASLSCSQLNDEALSAQASVTRLKPLASGTNALQWLSLLTALAGGGGTVNAGDTQVKKDFREARDNLSEIVALMETKGCSQDVSEFAQTLADAGA